MSSYVCPLPDYCVNREADGIHINAQGEPIVAEVGCDQAVIIDKLFGLLAFTPLRVSAVFASNEWRIEQQNGETMEWVEVARVPGFSPTV